MSRFSHLSYFIDAAANDSDKTLTPSSQRQFMVDSVYVTLVTTATANPRQIEVQFLDEDSVILARIVPGDVQIASLTFNYWFAPHLPDLGAERDSNLILTGMPGMRMPAGGSVRVFDNNAVDAAADDMTVVLGLRL